MPNFSQPFNGNNLDRKLTKDEIIRAVRFSIASEYEAIQLYEQIKDSIDDKTVKQIFQDIANEEKVHVGEFLKTLYILTPKEMELLVNLRETKFKSVLYDLISDYWLQPQPKSKYTLKEEQLINKRGRNLLLNDNFIRLLEECYDFVLPRK